MTLVAVTMAACADDVENTLDTSRCIEIKNVTPILKKGMTRVSVPELKDYVGKDEFDNEDRAVFTTIKRTTYAISQFTYKDLEFVCAASTSAEGVTSIGWSRDKNKGSTETTGDAHPDRIYWSDATHEHTFTGFCTPQQGGGKAFDWEEKSGAYYGSIGDPTVYNDDPASTDHIIDYRSTFDGEGKETLSGNVELRKNDILLTHSTAVKAQDAIAKLYFYHGLAQVRVIVNISEFAAGGGADTLSRVSDMILKDMLTMYKWRKNSVVTEQLTDGDQSLLDDLYTSAGVAYNQKKDFNLWIPQRNGVGYKSSRTFTFYGMVVPTEYDPEHPEDALAFSFKVTYPDPMNPSVTKTHTYNASIGGIRFDSGKCTTISISLNHKNEKMTVGAEYDDWEFVQTPDQGELKKNSTFLASTARTQDSEGNYNVTIIGDQNATVDDATWLYIDGTTNKIVDVYGNDGSEEHPFQISTADQLLSFAYEVKGTGRTSVTYDDLDGTNGKTLSEGFDFKGYHIALDAGITLQATATRTKQEMKSSDDGYSSAPDAISWIGIGAADKPFNGIFLGGFRHINRLYDSPLFINIGPYGVVDHLSMSSTVSILGSGSIAETNEGIICGAYIEGDIVETAATQYSGSIVGVNEGVLIACTHIGNITSNSGTLGALLGYNNGIVVTCYNVGDAKNTAGRSAYAGIGAFSAQSIAYCCYFNADLYTSDDYDNLKEEPQIGHVAFPLTTAEMQSSKFVNQAASVGEITDVRDKTDIFFYHWALKEGLNRAIALLSTVYDAHPDTPDDDYLYFHEEADRGGYLRIGLKKSQVKWLIDHYAGHAHEFKFVPGTYPRLQ